MRYGLLAVLGLVLLSSRRAFGRAFARNTNDLQWPISLDTPSVRLSSGFGWRVLNGVRERHDGLDIAAPIGTPIRAVAAGTIVSVRLWETDRNAAGNRVAVDHDITGLGRVQSRYFHLDRFAAGLVAGQVVQPGQVLGYVGRTGRATGPHLHLELLAQGPLTRPVSSNGPRLDPIAVLPVVA